MPEASAGAPAAPATEASAAPAGSGHASLLDPAPNSQQATAGSIDFDVLNETGGTSSWGALLLDRRFTACWRRWGLKAFAEILAGDRR